MLILLYDLQFSNIFSYVRNSYFSIVDRIPTTATAKTIDNNWVSLVYKTFVENYVPLELFHGLVKCGKTFALYAVNPSQSIVKLFNVNFTIIPGFGK